MVDVVATLRSARVVPVIRHDDPGVALEACELLAAGGIEALEITTTVPDAAGIIADFRSRFPSICVGAGTVLTTEQVEQVISAGAEFVVSPCWSDEVARALLDARVPYLPGAMTPGEVLHHASSGATLVKVFPAEAAGGPSYLKALKTVFPDVALMPTGGVTPANAKSYLDAGALCVGMGGNLLPATALEVGNTTVAVEQINSALTAVFSQDTKN
ncbi:bifunctional 4-hydroxy-2-oxoglutarate aldolase/2-dehydro-3-deoxy-phosphogluconate aldolase [Ruegeria meonggei]|uniref:KHG/KDPG aldolase n=1 Tax=Ruegeria meonggei TaxID=1446476 RepID=A0A1X6Z3U0_9RHOB|nr:bifunctional 4-hydroxy-2-oxoglutarate aldolase/2-dehydro-3-deoxy-phosphogluconate aldolase [Ruegeria meonggei]SLN40080.1 KHG/KDPG aldolase [Ruegeria meonggei]